MKKASPARTAALMLLTVSLSVACVPGVIAIAQEQTDAHQQVQERADLSNEKTTADVTKAEVVYVSLNASGSPTAAYVVNRFDVASAGTVVDKGAYDKVINLTNSETLQRSNDLTAFEVEEGTFYYQGDMSSVALPWNISITYTLNGKVISPDALPGSTGELVIRVHTYQNEAVPETFFESYMLQTTFTLPATSCTNVVSDDGMVATAGKDRTVAFTTLPGHTGDFTLTATVDNFEMPAAQIVALPYKSVIEMPDTEGMEEPLVELSDAVSLLAEGVDELSSGTSEFSRGVQSLTSGTVSFGDGLRTLDGSSSELLGASSQIKGALASISEQVNGTAGGDSPASLATLAANLENMAVGLDEIQANLGELSRGFDQAQAALSGAIAAIPDATVGQGDIASLSTLASTQGTQSDVATVAALASNYEAAQTVKATYGAVAQAYDATSGALSTLGAPDGPLAQQAQGLHTIASSLAGADGSDQAEALGALAAGLASLSASYGSFDEGLQTYMGGVSTLACNYRSLETGASALEGGADSLAGGARELASGASQLNDATITLPETMRTKIDEMMADYDFPEFEERSFVSGEENGAQEVQFIMTTPAVEIPEPEIEEEPEEELSFWDRVMKLFS